MQAQRSRVLIVKRTGHFWVSRIHLITLCLNFGETGAFFLHLTRGNRPYITVSVSCLNSMVVGKGVHTNLINKDMN